jgi:hypothetical protein
MAAMADFIVLMHNDGGDEQDAAWAVYLAGLERSGALRGGSAIGGGECVRKAGAAPPVTPHLAGFIRLEARDLAHAKTLLAGNPALDAGATVEIRELPRTD